MTANIVQAQPGGPLADHPLDYTSQDFTRTGQRYDVIIAANGDRSTWDYRRALIPHGHYVMTGGSNRQPEAIRYIEAGHAAEKWS